MNAHQVDMQDSRARWKPSIYRVYFWRPLGSITPRDPLVGVPYESSAFELTEVSDVSEALSWASANADGRTFTLYAVYERGTDQALIHVAGLNPTEARVTAHQREEVARLFAEHGLTGDIKMLPVTTVDERVFIVAEEDLARMPDIDGLVKAASRALTAPVRLVTSAEVEQQAHQAPALGQ